MMVIAVLEAPGTSPAILLITDFACAVALGYGIKTYIRHVIYAIMPPYEVKIAQIMIVSIYRHHNMLWWTPYCTIIRARLYGTVV